MIHAYMPRNGMKTVRYTFHRWTVIIKSQVNSETRTGSKWSNHSHASVKLAVRTVTKPNKCKTHNLASKYWFECQTSIWCYDNIYITLWMLYLHQPVVQLTNKPKLDKLLSKLPCCSTRLIANQRSQLQTVSQVHGYHSDECRNETVKAHKLTQQMTL